MRGGADNDGTNGIRWGAYAVIFTQIVGRPAAERRLPTIAGGDDERDTVLIPQSVQRDP